MSESKIQYEIRTRLGLTQTDFCKYYNISRSTVSCWGNKKRPISPKHIQLLKTLGISQSALEKPWEKV